MNRLRLIIASLINTVILCSCGIATRYIPEYQENPKETTEKVMEAIQSQDKEAMKSLMSQNTIGKVKNLDKEIEELFDYVKGEGVTFVNEEDVSGPQSEESMDNGNRMVEQHTSYDIKTSKDTYRIAIFEVIIDTAKKDNIGIHSMYVLKMSEDKMPEYVYRGDFKDTPGIHVKVPSELPRQEDEVDEVDGIKID